MPRQERFEPCLEGIPFGGDVDIANYFLDTTADVIGFIHTSRDAMEFLDAHLLPRLTATANSPFAQLADFRPIAALIYFVTAAGGVAVAYECPPDRPRLTFEEVLELFEAATHPIRDDHRVEYWDRYLRSCGRRFPDPVMRYTSELRDYWFKESLHHAPHHRARSWLELLRSKLKLFHELLEVENEQEYSYLAAARVSQAIVGDSIAKRPARPTGRFSFINLMFYLDRLHLTLNADEGLEVPSTPDATLCES